MFSDVTISSEMVACVELLFAISELRKVDRDKSEPLKKYVSRFYVPCGVGRVWISRSCSAEHGLRESNDESDGC